MQRGRVCILPTAVVDVSVTIPGQGRMPHLHNKSDTLQCKRLARVT